MLACCRTGALWQPSFTLFDRHADQVSAGLEHEQTCVHILSNVDILMLHLRPTPQQLEQVFKELKAAFSPSVVPADATPESYNMVLTSKFMMLVPRSREVFGPVAVNSMGFAGSLFVRSKEELDFICSESPMQVLTAVGVPWSDRN